MFWYAVNANGRRTFYWLKYGKGERERVKYLWKFSGNYFEKKSHFYNSTLNLIWHRICIGYLARFFFRTDLLRLVLIIFYAVNTRFHVGKTLWKRNKRSEYMKHKSGKKFQNVRLNLKEFWTCQAQSQINIA